MDVLGNRQGLVRIAEDKLRNVIADYGALAVSVPRRLSRAFGSRSRYMQLLMFEHRLSLNGRLTPLIRESLPEILEILPALMGPAEPEITLDNDGFRAIVLREPMLCDGHFRRGVLLIKFTETFRFFFHQVDIQRLMRCFRIVLEPSWSGYCLPEILMWAQHSEPVIVQSSEVLDRRFLEEIRTNLFPIEIGASDWVDHRVFHPLGVEKVFDVAYVANLTPIKRINVFLRAIREISRKCPDFRAVIVLSSWGGNQEAFEQMVRWYGVTSNVTVLMNQTQEQLNEILNRSRVSVLLSRKEGSNKTLFESMFANTPVILLSNNIGVNKDYINSFTGKVVAEKDLSSAIMEFGANTPVLQPRVWAMANISPERSVEKLQARLAELEASSPESRDALFVKVNTPEATYADPAVAARMPDVSAVLRLFTKDSPAGGAELEGQLLALFAAARSAG